MTADHCSKSNIWKKEINDKFHIFNTFESKTSCYKANYHIFPKFKITYKYNLNRTFEYTSIPLLRQPIAKRNRNPKRDHSNSDYKQERHAL